MKMGPCLRLVRFGAQPCLWDERIAVTVGSLVRVEYELKQRSLCSCHQERLTEPNSARGCFGVSRDVLPISQDQP